MKAKPSTLSSRDRKNTATKRANANKLRVIENAKRILNNITICNIFVPEDKKDGWGNSAVFDGNKPIKVTHALAWNLDNIRVKWEVTCGVFCRTQQGEHYIQYFTMEADRECYSTDVSEQAQKICAWLFNNAVKLEKLAPFWLAIPRTIEDHVVDLNLAYKTAHLHKVFNRLGTNFEIDCNLPYVDYHQGDWFNIPFNWDKTKSVEVPLDEALNLTLKTLETEYGTKITTT